MKLEDAEIGGYDAEKQKRSPKNAILNNLRIKRKTGETEGTATDDEQLADGK